MFLKKDSQVIAEQPPKRNVGGNSGWVPKKFAEYIFKGVGEKVSKRFAEWISKLIAWRISSEKSEGLTKTICK